MQRALSMRRLAAVTLVVFVLLLAFLAGRVRAGADPTQKAAPASSQVRPDATPAEPSSPYGTDPYGTGPSVSPYDGGGSVAPDPSPPVTHAS
jgi:hypothetical protein